MKKPFFITLGISILLIALGVWGYLFLFGTPSSTNDVFTDLGFDIVDQKIIPLPEEEFFNENDTTLIDVEGVPLRQLTFRPVAGFISYEKDDVLFVRYMEKGTGHIYDINLTTGEEVRVSNTTNSRVVYAVFGTTAEYVAFQTEVGYTRETFVAHILESENGGKLETASLPPNADNLSFTGASSLHYTLTDTRTVGYIYDTSTADQTAVFAVPFLSIKSTILGDSTITSNRYAPELLGTSYTVDGPTFTSTMPQRFGFNALITPAWQVFSYIENNELKNEAVSRVGNQAASLPISIIPEKCTYSTKDTNKLWCASPLTNTSTTYTKDWYQGKVRSNDAIWEVHITTERAILIANPTTLLGREVDVSSISSNDSENALFFTNKNDDTLWYYDLLAS